MTNMEYCDGNRNLLLNLKPRSKIDEDVSINHFNILTKLSTDCILLIFFPLHQVLNLVVCMMSLQEKSISKYKGYWFLPTTFAVGILDMITNIFLNIFQLCKCY